MKNRFVTETYHVPILKIPEFKFKEFFWRSTEKRKITVHILPAG